jgi:hypothetical protein
METEATTVTRWNPSPKERLLEDGTGILTDLGGLHKAIDALVDSSNLLFDRIGPILGPPPDSEPSRLDRSPAASDLHETLLCARDAVETLRDRIDVYRQRIDL